MKTGYVIQCKRKSVPHSSTNTLPYVNNGNPNFIASNQPNYNPTSTWKN